MMKQLDDGTIEIHQHPFVEKIERDVFRIILTQGLNRQIRRMCQYLSYNVTSLKRVRIMNIKLDIPIGTWRDLRKKELERLHFLLRDSQKRMMGQRTTRKSALRNRPTRTVDVQRNASGNCYCAVRQEGALSCKNPSIRS